MKAIKKIKSVLRDRNNLFSALSKRGFFNWLDDATYYRLLFHMRMGYKLDFGNPQTFNEKLQWLKLNDRKPIYSTMVDKCEAKKYVAERIGEKYIIPTIGVWNSIEEIDYDNLPNQFVLKTTHDSGGVVICKDKKTFDFPSAKERLGKNLRRNYFWTGREWPYKNVKPRIMAEEYLAFLGDSELVEYKVFCFNGEPKLILVCQGEGHGAGRTNDFYDLEFNHIPVTVTNPNAKEKCKKPKEYAELLALSKVLAKDTYQLRVDFYVMNHKIFFGELTFFHDSGYCNFNPKEWDRRFGEMLELPINRSYCE